MEACDGSSCAVTAVRRERYRPWRGSPLVQERAWKPAGFLAVMDGEEAALVDSCGAVGAVFSEGVHADAEVWSAVLVAVALFEVFVGDAFDDGEAGFGGGHSCGHVLDGEEGAAVCDDGFAASGCAGCADVVVHVHTRAHDGRVAETAWDLVGQAAGGGACAEIAFGVDGRAVDGAVGEGNVDVHAASSWTVFGPVSLVVVEPVVAWTEVLLPAEPGFAGAIGEEVFLLESVGEGESAGAIADDEDVVGALKDEESNLGCVADALERPHCSGLVRGAVHDGGVELDDAILVWESSETDAHVVWIIFDDGDPFDHGIDRIGALGEEFHGFADSGQAVAGRYGADPSVLRSGVGGLCMHENFRERGATGGDCRLAGCGDAADGGEA